MEKYRDTYTYITFCWILIFYNEVAAFDAVTIHYLNL